MNANPIFFEERQIGPPWVRLLVGCTCLLAGGSAIYGAYQQLYLHRPFGNRPMSDRALAIFTISMLVFVVAMALLFFKMRLTTRVDAQQIHVRMLPFLNRRIPRDRVARWEPCTYRPILDYGGWGIRYSWRKKGWAYNISGNRGLRLELTSGKRLLIGSRRPEEFAAALAGAIGRG